MSDQHNNVLKLSKSTPLIKGEGSCGSRGQLKIRPNAGPERRVFRSTHRLFSKYSSGQERKVEGRVDERILGSPDVKSVGGRKIRH